MRSCYRRRRCGDGTVGGGHLGGEVADVEGAAAAEGTHGLGEVVSAAGVEYLAIRRQAETRATRHHGKPLATNYSKEALFNYFTIQWQINSLCQ